jgi:hypothetical protein
MGLVTRLDLTRRISGSISEARTASDCTLAAHDSTMSSGVCAEEVLANKRWGTDEPGQIADGQRPQRDPWMAAPDARCQSQHALGRYRRHQDSGRGIAVFQVALNDAATQGMCNEHRPAAQIVGDGADIADIVSGGTCVKSLGGRARAVSAQAQGDRVIAGIGKEVQEVVPTRRGTPTAVHEKQRYQMGFAPGPLVDHLEHELTFV